ncbi:MAG TPA: histidinol dehydrogenase [Nitrososphaeraceae archaeon]|jgi:histidinol dehydrogenase
MIKTIRIKDPVSDAQKLRGSTFSTSNDVNDTIDSIFNNVIAYGDDSLYSYTKKFDKIDLSSLRVTKEDIRRAYRSVGSKQVQSLQIMKKRIVKNEILLLKGIKASTIETRHDGVSIQKVIQPLANVGCYIPGGNARYPSTLVMCAVPARIAGVQRIVAISPPMKNGDVDPMTVVAADICNVDELYRVGGVQGIAALAFGTKTIRKVDKIVGPGGKFVTHAKMAASRYVSIDMIAGPTELVVYSDNNTHPSYIARDLISQAEHSIDTFCGLVTTSEALANEVKSQLTSIFLDDQNPLARSEIIRKSIESSGFIALCDNESSAAMFINEIAPEHLQVISKNANRFAKKITSAGLILLGTYSPSSASDYLLGSNHVLPTSGFGRSRGSLSVLDFIKITNKISVSRKGLADIAPLLKEITTAEGLLNHYEAVKERFSK